MKCTNFVKQHKNDSGIKYICYDSFWSDLSKWHPFCWESKCTDVLVTEIQETKMRFKVSKIMSKIYLEFTKYYENRNLGAFKKYVRSIFPSFDPLPSPFFAIASFQAPPTPEGTSVLARTHPLLLNFYTCEI